MASLSRSPYGVYALTFRYGGQRYHRSLRTKSEAKAERQKGVIEAALEQLEIGLLVAPLNVTADQLWQILQSCSAQSRRPRVSSRVALHAVCREYLASYTRGTKEDSTIATETHHLNHLKRLLGADTSLSELTPAILRQYVTTRETERGTHGRGVSAVTISKELATFRQLWEFARNESLVSGENPLGCVRKPRPSDRPRFMTTDEIEEAVERGGLSEADVAMFWECLFLRECEIAEFLAHVEHTSKTYPRFRYIYPAIAFCAYTGCRRSEMFRAQVSDISGANVQIREKKRSKRETFTFRQVPKHPYLETILDAWLVDHPGGQVLFCKNNLEPLDDKTSREAFEAVTKRSRWCVLRGYHILRHSFASNLARHAIDQRTIDEFMGHQTEASRKRYRHLFPEDCRSAISVLDFRQKPEGNRDKPNLRVVG